MASTEELGKLGKKYDKLGKEITALTSDRNVVKEKLLAGMVERGEKSIKFKDGFYVTFVAPETPVVDPDIVKKLNKAQKMAVLDQVVDLGMVPLATRQQVLDILNTPKLRKSVKETLNLSKLTHEVQEGKIPGKLLAQYTTMKPKAPYPKTGYEAK